MFGTDSSLSLNWNALWNSQLIAGSCSYNVILLSQVGMEENLDFKAIIDGIEGVSRFGKLLRLRYEFL